jgi:hypothetical protein
VYTKAQDFLDKISELAHFETTNKFKVGDKVKFVSGSDYVEPKDRSKVFKVMKVRGNECELDNQEGYIPSKELYKV